MFSKILGGVRHKSDGFIKKNIKSKESYGRLKWNFIEKIIISSSKYPGRALSCLLLFFSFIFTGMHFLRPHIQPLATKWLPHWDKIFDWQTTLLGGQLTIIGVVYPLVVGLISIIFQKKSARKIVQAAYQSYSGFMLAGLSGLVLSGFILLGIFIRTFCSNYTYAVLCAICVIWMIINIALSVWFFIKSLSVLNDVERDRMVLRFLTADVLAVTLKKRVSDMFSAAPLASKLIDASKYPHISVEDYSFERDFTVITKKGTRNEVVKDIYFVPLKMVFFFINRLKRREENRLSFAFYHPLEGKNSEDHIPLFKVRGLSPDSFFVRLMKLCFRTARPANGTVDNLWIIRGMLGEAVDALAAGDIYAFEEALDSICRDFTAIADVFSFSNELEAGNLLLIKNDALWEQSFSQMFYGELYRLNSQAVLRMALSGRFFSRCMHLPRILFERRVESSFEEISLGMTYSIYAWETLMSWGKLHVSKVDPTLRQTYDELVMEFVALWEGWPDSLHYKIAKAGNISLFHSSRVEHLRLMPDVLMHAVVAGDDESVRHAADMFNRWLNRPTNDSGHTGLLIWQEFFITPAIFDGDEPFNPKNLSGTQTIHTDNLPEHAFSNALTDVRLCTAAFLLHHGSELNADVLRFTVDTLLSGKLVDNTGGFERVSLALTKSSDVVDVLIRITAWGRKNSNPASGWLSGMIRHMSSQHGKRMISGRIYSGNRLSGISDLYGEFAELMMMLSSVTGESVSNRFKSCLSAGLLSYGVKETLAESLQQTLAAVERLKLFRIENGKDVNACKDATSALLKEYLKLLTKSMEQDVLSLPVSVSKVDALSRKVSEMLRVELPHAFPFNQFDELSYHDELESSIRLPVLLSDDKLMYTEEMRHKVVNQGRDSYLNIFHILRKQIFDRFMFENVRREIMASNLSEILDIASKLPDTEDGDYLIICNQAMKQELNYMMIEHSRARSDGVSLLYYDSENRLTLRGVHKDLPLEAYSIYGNHDPYIVNCRAFSKFRIKEPAGKSSIYFSFEKHPEVDSRILLRANLEYMFILNEPAKIRFVYPVKPDMV
ncbi:hypothetical protein [Pantoea stewartii]|uniref:MFS transporter n=1 Tax=Pantoea stewartii TaxID=66269 RepID=A0AB34VFV9_9GAMM|nr:hypothetical protein [Pantoea stewartii]KTS72252.1 hypothetical protein RSA30_15710 [Pantoea stewartii]KTS97605.1 hypothetical protein RSA13_10915 [Pantoea stewartii]KTT06631.1 hypothetical protein RSA36_15515 [Pantoea stewartii]